MNDQPIRIDRWPSAIMHLDADAFFASCEQAVNPGLKGKPVITGKERGIVAAASYEAKARGVKRGMRLFEAKKVCPDLVCLPSDYEIYSLFSLRMFEIVRRFSPDIEEYSIDEAFVDLTGLRRIFHCSYGDIARKIQETVEKELGITISIGVSLSKVLAKVGSKHKKPKGITLIPGREISHYLADLLPDKIWGIGPNTSALLKKLGVGSALDFAKKDISFIKKHLSKPYVEVWHELNGRSVMAVSNEGRSDYQSIGKTKTFTPPSSDESFVFAQLSKNLENACIKVRRHHLAATRLVVLLKGQDFVNEGAEIKLSRATAYPAELFDALKKGFSKIYSQGRLYRSTGVVMSGLVPENKVQYSLFDDLLKVEKISRIYNVVDMLSKKFGKHAVCHGSSLPVRLQLQYEGERGDIPERKKDLFKGENRRQRLGVPLLGIKI
ncbi:MAG: DNA polymerase IV [Proteobacteria bacterium]|nr:DNA polymerase IV [Pseudomonadota bacterium]